MNNNVNFVFINGTTDPRETLKGMMKLLEVSDLFNDALRAAAHEAENFSEEADRDMDEAPDFTDFGGALVELADTAEMYRDKLDSFIAEADRLLAAFDDLDVRGNTMGCYTRGE
ncbi:MAG: hypothetical protein LUC40_07245 [Oscillospiraceae bacterium]|nr:hypothetical protein [Oscillospiraceae bacterium]